MRAHSMLYIVGIIGACSRREPYTPPADGADDTDTVQDEEGISEAGACIPGEGSIDPLRFSEYAAMCEPELGVAPVVDCGTSVEVPILIDGVKVDENQALFACDAPSLQRGECIPGSSLQRYAGQDADGTPRPEVVWVSLCRNDGIEVAEGDGIHDSVQLIGYNSETGATCFFESGDNKAYLSIGEDGRLLGTMPGPGDPGFETAYTTPGDTICVECHQSDPFVHNPWVDSARLPGNPDEPVVPNIAGFDAPYYVIGGGLWDMRTLYIEGNACLSCHRVGMETEAQFRTNNFPATAHMPPQDPGSLTEDYQALLDCWAAGPEDTPGCEWIIPPGDGCSGGIVGDDYPYPSADFNTGGEAGDAPLCDEGEWFSVFRAATELHCTYSCVGKGYAPIPNSSDACPVWDDALEDPCGKNDVLTAGSTNKEGERVTEESHTCTDGAWSP